MSEKQRIVGLLLVMFLTAALWVVNLLWLRKDTRPPVWDMALHQSYALNYLPEAMPAAQRATLTERSGNYPPFVHLMIAFCFAVLHPDSKVATLANIPATFLLLWAVYQLAEDLAGAAAARWACLLTALTPYLIWMSRETILDYWLAAWVAAGLLALRGTEAFASHPRSLLFGLTCALGLLTKWFFAGFLIVPLLYVCIRSRIWRDRSRMIHLADAALISVLLAGTWYLPNLPNLMPYFVENARIGAREGEPAVFSFQSLIYYLRLLEGYQLFGILFFVLLVSAIRVWRKGLKTDGLFLLAAIFGGWLAMTLLRTKDPRFTMPLLGPLLILAGAWLQDWKRAWWATALKVTLILVLGFQAYMISFGVRRLPEEVVLARGYSGSLRWDWNLYLQHYFRILGPPRREDWKQEEILRKMAEDANAKGMAQELALIPDLPRFNSVNFQLAARFRGYPAKVAHIQSEPNGMRSFDGFNYLVLTEGDQGMSWSTVWSRALNQIVFDNPGVYRLIALYPLPDGSSARLYFIERDAAGKAAAQDEPGVRRRSCGAGARSAAGARA